MRKIMVGIPFENHDVSTELPEKNNNVNTLTVWPNIIILYSYPYSHNRRPSFVLRTIYILHTVMTRETCEARGDIHRYNIIIHRTSFEMINVLLRCYIRIYGVSSVCSSRATRSV